MPSFLFTMLTSTREILFSAFKTLLRGPSVLQTIFAVWLSPLLPRRIPQQSKGIARLLDDYVAEVEHSFGAPTESASLLSLSSGIQRQLNEASVSNTKCMLPSYNHQLPTGNERGRFLALDVGGSTLRIALIDLQGKGNDTARIIQQRAWKVDVARKLRGNEFFDWMASKIEEVVDLDYKNCDPESLLPMGLSWSFPIECVTLFLFWYPKYSYQATDKLLYVVAY